MSVQLPQKIAVMCRSKADAKRLMCELAAKTTIVWYSGATPSADFTYWASNRPYIVYAIEHGRISYGTDAYAKRYHIPIVECAEFLWMLDGRVMDEDDVAIDLATVL